MATGGPLRQPIPTARSILWSPAAGGGGTRRPGDIPFPVFLLQSALAAIYEHLAAPPKPGQGMLGFLLGDLCECPETNVSYLVVDAALRLNQAIYSDRTRDVVTRLWDRVQAQLEEQQAHLIGWYHSHPPLPLGLTEYDLETHEQYFGEPWQIALLVGTDPAEPAGAMFRASADEEWVNAPVPFYELLNPDSIRPDGKKRSVVTWKNYRAFSAVGTQSGPHAAVSPTTVPRMPAATPPAEPKFTPAPPRPKSPAPEPEPERSTELKFLTAAEDLASPAPPPRAAPPPRRYTPPPRPAPPPEPEPEPEPVPEAEAEPELEPEAAAAEAVGTPVWPEEFEAPAEEEVAPPEELEERPPRPRRPRRKLPRKVKRALLLVVLVATAAGAYWWFQPELPLAQWSATARGAMAATWSTLKTKASGLSAKVSALKTKVRRTERKPAPPPPAPPPPRAQPKPDATAAAASPPAHVPTAFAALDAIGDSVTQSVRTFGDYAVQFNRGQLACAGLVSSLSAVEKRWLTYNAARKSAGVLDAARAVRDQGLYARVDSVERRFEQTGCPRS